MRWWLWEFDVPAGPACATVLFLQTTTLLLLLLLLCLYMQCVSVGWSFPLGLLVTWLCFSDTL
jgi:hypothetical protein